MRKINIRVCATRIESWRWSVILSDIETLRAILGTNRTIAVVGLSADWFRPSYFAAKYMQEHGYRIIPVNPKYSEILGEPCYKSLSDIPDKVDMVDVFRKTEDVLPIARAGGGDRGSDVLATTGRHQCRGRRVCPLPRHAVGYGSMREDRTCAAVWWLELGWGQYQSDFCQTSQTTTLLVCLVPPPIDSSLAVTRLNKSRW